MWASTLALSGSSAIALVALSRLLPGAELAGISSVFVLAFIVGVLPMAIQGRACAVRAASAEPAAFEWHRTAIPIGIAVVSSPFLARAIHLPTLAVLCPVLMVIPATAVAVIRGNLVGQRRYGPVALGQSAEAIVRSVAGIGLGWPFGPTGMAVGLLLGSVVAAGFMLPYKEDGGTHIKPSSVLISLATLTAVVNVDVLGASAVLHHRASEYAVAVLPGKAVFLALMGAGWLLVPASVGYVATRSLYRVVAAFLGVGLAAATVATALAPVLSDILGHHAAPELDVAIVAAAMAMAGTTWAAMMILVGRQSGYLWLPALAGAVTLGFAVIISPTITGVAVGMACSQAVGLLVAVTLARLTFRRPRGSERAPTASASTGQVAHEVEPSGSVLDGATRAVAAVGRRRRSVNEHKRQPRRAIFLAVTTVASVTACSPGGRLPSARSVRLDRPAAPGVTASGQLIIDNQGTNQLVRSSRPAARCFEAGPLSHKSPVQPY